MTLEIATSKILSPKRIFHHAHQLLLQMEMTAELILSYNLSLLALFFLQLIESYTKKRISKNTSCKGSGKNIKNMKVNLFSVRLSTQNVRLKAALNQMSARSNFRTPLSLTADSWVRTSTWLEVLWYKSKTTLVSVLSKRRISTKR